MHCMRCDGLTVPNHIFDLQRTSGQLMWRRSQRCMNCGHIARIEQRGGTEAAHPVILSSEPDYHDEEVHLGKEAYLAPLV